MMNNIGTDMRNDILVALLQDPITQECAIEVFDNNGIVTLAGVVPSQETSERAEAIARTVPGVGSVINELVVAAHSI